MLTGNRGGYHWIVWNSQFLGDLIAAIPQIVIGKYVVTEKPSQVDFEAGMKRSIALEAGAPVS